VGAFVSSILNFEKLLLVGVVMAAGAQPEVSRAQVHRGGHIKACGRRPLPRTCQ
jgi:hypothetical protein